MGIVRSRPARWSCRARTSAAWSTRRRREGGLGYIPQDRHRNGLAARGAPVGERRARPPDGRPVRARALDRPRAAPRAAREEIVGDYDVRTPGIEVAGAGPVRRQPAEADRRAARWRRSRKVLIAAHPDARRRRRRAGGDLGPAPRGPRAAGLAMLLVSADLEELIGLSDRLVVLFRGRARGHAAAGRGHPRDPRLVHDGRGARGGRVTLRRAALGARRAGIGHRHLAGRLVARAARLGRQPARHLPDRCGPSAPQPNSIISMVNRAVPLLPGRAGGRRRVQDEPLQHRGGGAVLPRRDRGGRGRRSR